MQEAVGWVLVTSLVLCVVLSGLTVARKMGRDRSEALFQARRARFRGLFRFADSRTLTAELQGLGRAHSAQVDLLVALDTTRPQLDQNRRVVIQQSVVASQLDHALARQLRSPDAVLRATAALLVARLRLPDASTIIAPLVHDRDSDVRLVAVRALADLADRKAARVLVDTLRAGLLEPERVIERLGDDWAVGSILEVLDGDGNALRDGDENAATISPQSIAASLARALGLAGDPAAEPTLRRLLRSGTFEERVSAARALGTAGSLAAVPDLERALVDVQWPLRAQAARSLGLLRAAAGVGPLAACLDDSAWWVRAAAAEALTRLGEPGLTALRDALLHPDPYARDRAREALALHGLVSVAR